MNYDEAQRHAKDGKRVRHKKMGEGWAMIHERGRFICAHPTYKGRSAPDAHDRAAKDWEIVGDA